MMDWMRCEVAGQKCLYLSMLDSHGKSFLWNAYVRGQEARTVLFRAKE